VRELPIHADHVTLKPLLKEVLTGVRDVLTGRCWLGAKCEVGGQSDVLNATDADGRGRPFCLMYLGSTGVAAYGLGLSLVAFVAARMVDVERLEAVPEHIRKTAVRIDALVVPKMQQIQQQYFDQLDASFASVSINRRPTDWEFRDAILKMGALDSPNAVVEAYQERQKSQPDRKLKGSAVWRMSCLVNPSKLPETAADRIATLRAVSDDSVLPITLSMTGNKNFYVGSRSRKTSDLLAFGNVLF